MGIHGYDTGKTCKKARKQNIGSIEYPIAEHGYSALYYGKQRYADGIGTDNHIDFVYYLLCVGFIERKKFVDILLHFLSAYQHEVEDKYQYKHVDDEAADASH